MIADLDDDMLSAGAIADPYSYFRRVRERDPVHWNQQHRSWLLTRYSDCHRALRDPRLTATRIQALADDDPVYRLLTRWMVFTDPPDHTRLRRLGGAALPPTRIETARARIRFLVEQLLDTLASRPEPDLVRDLASPLPVLVMSELLGIPENVRTELTPLSNDLAMLFFADTDHDLARGRRGLQGLIALLDPLIGRYRQEPGNNVISDLVHAEGSDRLDGQELLAMLTMLLFGGHVNTTNLIANGLLALIRHADAAAHLRSRPDLIGPGVEELLRYDGPSKVSARMAEQDLELGGRRIRAGDRVLIVRCSANHDPERFLDPERLRLDRPDNRHLAFGLGLHHCLGAHLARLEGQIAILATLRRFPGIETTTGETRWRATLLGRGLEALPVCLDTG